MTARPSPAQAPAPARSRLRDRPGLLAAVLVFLALIYTAVASLGAPLLPAIAAAGHVSLAASQWALTITLLAGAVLSPVMGRLGDSRWRRPVILAGVAAVLAGCVASAAGTGFAVLLAGRALQGAGLGLVPLVTAVARDGLPAGRSRRTIALAGITTAAGVGAGYPLAGLIAQYLGLAACFWCGAAVSAVALAAAAAVLPPGPDRPARLDLPAAALLGAGVAALVLVLAQGPAWGWASLRVLATTAGSALLLAGWAARELRAASPLVELRLLRRRPVLAANATGLLAAVGFYPLLSLVVRLVQTPPAAGYGFGAPVVVAGLMLTPFSLASFGASKVAGPLARRSSPELVVAASCLVLAGALAVFLVARGGYPPVLAATALAGLGVGCTFAMNPVQIVTGVPAAETGSAMSFYQLVRTAGYSLASALSATLLVAWTRPGQAWPDSAGYTAAAAVSLAVLAVAFGVSVAFAVLAWRDRAGPGPDQQR